ncbi:SH3 and multiple ankyrin repeat domains protein 1, partial [Larimichthys crocea]
DYIIKEKTVLLQKKDSEGFGFVLRGAKAQTPIEEFTPTPAFPALQYLESVDEGGVAWRAGLRMGDFLIEVNGQNVVKVGHRQVVNMIRQGGNSLMVKVVMVTRNPDMEEGARKKIPQQSKRLSTPAIALRSKSMTSELEEMEFESSQVTEKKRTVYQMALNKLDEILAAAQQTISTNEAPGTRAQGPKRDRGRSFYGNEPNYGDQSGMGMMTSGLGLGYDRGQFTSGHGPPHGMLRQKSIGVPEEEKQFLHPPAMKFARSLSVPGPDDIPPPPTTAPPDPPFSSAPPLGWRTKTSQQPSVSVSQSTSTSAHYQPYSQSVHFTHGGRERAGGPSTGPSSGAADHTTSYAHASAHTAQSRTASRKVAYTGEPVGAGIGAGGGAKAAGLRRGYSTAVPPSSIATVMPQQQQTTQSQPQRADRSAASAAAGGPKGGARRGKGPLVKQSKVEDLRIGQGTLGGKGSVEKSSIPIPTIIVKAPSTSSSGRSSQGSSVEADAPASGETDEAKTPHGPPPSTPAPQPPAPPSIPAPPPPSLPSIRAQENLDFTSQFGAAIVGAARRDRERFHEARRKSASLFMSAEEDVTLGGVSDGIGGVTRTQVSQQQLSTQAESSSTRLRPSKSIDEGMFSGDTFIHHTRSMPPAFGLPEYSSPALDYQPKSVPTDLYTAAGRQPAPSTTTTFIHPLTGKALDPTSPLGLALAARERALRDDSRLRRGTEHHFTRQMSSVVFPSSTATSQPVSSTAQSSSSSYLVTSVFSGCHHAHRRPSALAQNPQRSWERVEGSASHATTASCAATTTAAATTTSTSTQLYHERAHTAHTTSSTSIMGSRRTGEHQRPPPATKKGESQETVVDSGIEELDSRSSSDHHLDSILALSGARLDRGERGGGAGGRMGGGGGAGESDRGGDFLESYMSYLDGQTFEMQNATAAASTYPKANRFREGGRTGDLHRQTSTAPASYHSHRRRDEQEDDDVEGGVTEDESGQDGPVYRTKALEFQFIPSRESRKAESHVFQRRRAPSPLISPSERPKTGPPRPSSLPLLPTSPLYSAMYDLRGSITPPSPGNPLGDPYFSPSPPLFAPSGAPPPPNSTLVVSRSLSPTHFLSGTSSPPLHPLPPPTCLSYPHLPPPSPTKPFASKPLPYWTKYDVADWLGYLNLGEHRERFLDNEIDGTHLPSLTKDDYLDLGVTRVGHRMNIERALRSVMDRLSSSPFPISVLSPRDGQTERRRDDGSRS